MQLKTLTSFRLSVASATNIAPPNLGRRFANGACLYHDSRVAKRVDGSSPFVCGAIDEIDMPLSMSATPTKPRENSRAQPSRAIRYCQIDHFQMRPHLQRRIGRPGVPAVTTAFPDPSMRMAPLVTMTSRVSTRSVVMRTQGSPLDTAWRKSDSLATITHARRRVTREHHEYRRRSHAICSSGRQVPRLRDT